MASIAVAGSIAQRPKRGGHAWVFLNYLIGLRRLNHDVLFIDRLTAGMLGNHRRMVDVTRSPEAKWLHTVMGRAGCSDDYFLLTDESESDGSKARLLDRLRGIDLLINVNGFLDDAELLDAPLSTAFLDIDPAIQQMWVDLGLTDLFAGHDLYFTVGENIGKSFCEVPTCGLEWLATRPPVVLDEWPEWGNGKAFTTIASWRGPYGSIEYRDESYGLRVHEFRRFMNLPTLIEPACSIALDIDAADYSDTAALRQAGWNLLDPAVVGGDPDAYRSFIRGSAAELSIAKNVYVRSRCGWFSDRSACYLASGKPVLAQETGYSSNLPTGEGLLSFADVDEAVSGAQEIHSNRRLHAMAAKALAHEYFDSKKVLGDLVHAAGV